MAEDGAKISSSRLAKATQPGRDLDVRVITEVLGWRDVRNMMPPNRHIIVGVPLGEGNAREVPPVSTAADAAFWLIEEHWRLLGVLGSKRFWSEDWMLRRADWRGPLYEVRDPYKNRVISSSSAPAHAVCLAALAGAAMFNPPRR